MPITVQVPDVGDVEFPDSMSQAQIVTAIETDIIPNFKRAATPKAGPSLPHKTTPEELAAVGLTGREKRIEGKVIHAGPFFDEAGNNLAEKPLVQFSSTGKEAAGVAAFETLTDLAGPGGALLKRIPGAQKVAAGVGRAVGGLVEAISSPAGAAMVPAAVLAPATVLPEMIKGGIDHGLEQIKEGRETGDISKISEGAANIGIAVSPVAHPIAKAIRAKGLEAAPATAEALSKSTAELIPESRRLTGPSIKQPEFSESTLSPERPPAGLLPAPGETGGTILLPESPLGPRTAGYRIKVEPFEERPVRSAEMEPEGIESFRKAVEFAKKIEPSGAKPFEAPAVSVDLRQLQKFMQKNTVSTMETWADKTIKDKLSGTSANPFFDPEFMAAAAVKGAILVKRGVVDFAEWSKPLIEQFGKGIEPHLRDLFNDSVALAGVVGKESEKVTAPPPLQTPQAEVIGAASGVIPKRFFEDMKSAAIEYGKIGGHLPDEVKQLQREMESTVAAGDAAARMNTRDFMAAIKEEYGLNRLEMLGGGSRRIPAADVQLFNDYLKGQVSPSQIAPRILPVLDTMRAEMTGLSNKIATELQTQLNQLPVSSPKYEPLLDLIEKIRNNADVYMNRSYKFFDSKKKAPAWYDDLPLGTRLAAEDYLIQNLPTAVTRAEAQSSLLRWLSDLRGEPASGGGSKVGAKDLSIFVRRKVIPQELRDVLGEYNNPMINYARSVEKMTRWVANNKFLNEVKQAGMGRFLFEEGMDPVGFNAQIAGDASNTMSPLNGLRTSQQIADAFRDIGDTPKHGAVARAYLTLNAWTKFAATAQSLMTQARNLSSRPFMAGMAGHWNLGEMGKSVRAIYEDFAGSDKAWRGKLDEYYKLGVIGDTSRAGELRAILKDASIQDVSPSELYSWSLGRALKTTAIKVPGEIYRLSDELGNIFGFENERAIQRRINPTWTDAQINKEAAKTVRQIYPTYSEAPKVIQSLRKVVVVGPFVNFPFQVYRTMWNGLSRSVTELRSSNPIERTVGAKRLASQIVTLGATYGLMEAGKHMLGISNQEEEDFRRFQPAWARNSKWLFTQKEDGELTAINLSFMDPYSYATDNTVAILSGIRNGDDPLEIFANVTKEMFRPWISEQMLTKSIIEARNGKTDQGREIFNPTDSAADKAAKQIGHVVKTLEPGTMQRAERRIIPAIKDEQPLYGRKLEVIPEIAREITGIAVEKFNFKNALAFKASEFSKLENSSEDVFRRTLSRTKTTTEADISDSYREANTRRLELWKGLRGDFMAALRSGVSKSEAESALKNRGVTKEVTEAIARGSYQPLEISSTMEDRAKERKRRIPMSEIRSIQSEFRGMNLDE